MAYAKQTWTNDDPATPLSGPRLTNMEKGIEDAHNAIDALPTPLALGTTASTAAAGNHTHAGFAPTTHQHTAAQISDASTVGRSVLQAADAAAARTAIGAGTGSSNLALGTTATTALKGDTVIPAATAAGTRAQLDAGTDTTVRAFSAKDVAEFVASKVTG